MAVELVRRPADPQDEEAMMVRAIQKAGWLPAAGLAERRFPLTTSEAAAVLRDGGHYDVDEAGLSDLVLRGLTRRPSVDENESWEWSAGDIAATAAVLESRRKWLPCEEHAGKLSAAEIEIRCALEDGIAAVEQCIRPPGSPRHDLRNLIEAIRLLDNREQRNLVLCHLEGVLFLEHEITV